MFVALASPAAATGLVDSHDTNNTQINAPVIAPVQTNVNTQVNTQTTIQGQAQGQQQGQAQSQRTRQSNSQSVNVAGDEIPRQAPAAIAPALATAPETCMGSTSVGASTPFGGVSFGTTWKSDSCEVRMFSRRLQELGLVEPALIILIQNSDLVRKAMEMAGYEGPGLSKQPAAKQTTRIEGMGPRVAEPIVAPVVITPQS